MTPIIAAEAVTDWVPDDAPEFEIVDSEPDLDADPEPDSVTHGYSIRLHRTGHWAFCIHGEHHKFFLHFEEARAYLAAAEAEWSAIHDEPWDPNAGTLDGHPAWEGDGR